MLSASLALITDEWIFGRHWCDFICATNYCLIIVSMLTLCCISIDRYHAVMHPLSYPLFVTRKRMVMVIAFTWIQGITFGIAPSIAGWVAFDYWEAICAIQWHNYRPDSIIYVVLAFLLCFLIPGIVLIYCYSKILQEVKKQKAQVAINTTGDSRAHEKNKRKVSDRSKIVWSLLVVVFAYFVCTTPFSVTKLIKVLANGKDPIPGPVNLLSALLGYVASAINPLIYGIFRRDFRTAYKHLLYSVFLHEKFPDKFSSDTRSQTGNGTISHANNLTINHEHDNQIATLEHALEELRNSSMLPKSHECSPKNVRFLPSVEVKSPTFGKDTCFTELNSEKPHLNAVGHNIENGKRASSALSCKHVMVKSVNGSTDIEEP
ncbi:octopamine receptor beta-3R-like [Ruditapes philippinarum]|uniref:octopamine receptor beta-3R-like n=1 Tax=Ruditapes philippinarum TaxID=129788 RepID=UPI00295B749F|nr:octopamine receptor beta-3R-like [Ruditapes philippinarum]